jgi:hypothetical protein
MKQILFLILTFCGICSGQAQLPGGSNTADTLRRDSNSTVPKLSVKVSPNPAKNRIEIALTGFTVGDIQLQLLDSKGNKQRMETRRLFSGNDVLTMMFILPPGFYVLVLRQKGKVLQRKVLLK